MNWHKSAFESAIRRVEKDATCGLIGPKEAWVALFNLRIMAPQTDDDRAYSALFDGKRRAVSRFPNGDPAVSVEYDHRFDVLRLIVHNVLGSTCITSHSMGPVESIENFAARVYLTCSDLGLNLDRMVMTDKPVKGKSIARRAEMDVSYDEFGQVYVWRIHERAYRWWDEHGVSLVHESDPSQ